MSNDPDRYMDQIFDMVLSTFSRDDTLTCSLQDWRKGRRAEVQEVNGIVVDVLRTQGRSAPMNDLIVEMALEIEAERRRPGRENAERLIMACKAMAVEV